MSYRQSRIIVLLASISSVTACAPIIRPPEEDPFTDEAIGFIEIGKTSKEDVEGKLIHQSARLDPNRGLNELARQDYHDGDWWLYAKLLRGWDLFDEGAPLSTRFLLLKFDKQGLVTNYKLSSPDRHGCSQDGICVQPPISYVLLASAKDDRVAKQFQIPEHRCGVYAYGDPGIVEVSISMDDTLVGSLVNDEHFFFWALEPGVHQLVANNYLAWKPMYTATAELECSSGDMYFFDLERNKGADGTPANARWVGIERQDDSTGRNAVAIRRLTLHETPLIN